MTSKTTRDEIIEAADDLFYRQGHEHTSFADIANVVKISRGNFYHHFRSKDEILNAVIDKIALEIQIEELRAEPRWTGQVPPAMIHGMSPASFRLYCQRVDASRNMARYHVLAIRPTLFGETAVVRSWGGSAGVAARGPTCSGSNRKPWRVFSVSHAASIEKATGRGCDAVGDPTWSLDACRAFARQNGAVVCRNGDRHAFSAKTAPQASWSRLAGEIEPGPANTPDAPLTP